MEGFVTSFAFNFGVFRNRQQDFEHRFAFKAGKIGRQKNRQSGMCVFNIIGRAQHAFLENNTKGVVKFDQTNQNSFGHDQSGYPPHVENWNISCSPEFFCLNCHCLLQ